MNELALFAGAGGGILGGVLSGFRTVCAVEKEPYCREVLLRRQRDGVLPMFPIWDDVRTFDGRAWRGIVDVVTAGFPCQPFSAAGKRRGEADERNMWPDTIRVIREVGPAFAFLENVPNLLAHDYFGEVLGSLAEAGFDAEWGVVSAAECGAPHLRERVWIVAYAECNAGRMEPGRRQREDGADSSELVHDGFEESLAESQSVGRREGGAEPAREQVGPGVAVGGEAMADADSSGRSDARRSDALAELDGSGAAGRCRWWDAEPGMGRTSDGLAKRLELP